MNFLPKNYQAPKSSTMYMKLQDGENKIRILTAPILGWEDWTLDKKPVRYRFDDKPLKSIDPKKPVKHFWGMVVWNYMEEQIQVLQLTQATIRNSIEALCNDKDWGAPYFYDIKIIKKGEGVDTEYMVNPLPHKALNPLIKQRFMERRCYLDALFDNADPFDPKWGEFTDGIFDEKQEPVTQERLNVHQLYELEDILADCGLEFKNQLLDRLKVTVENIPPAIYDRVKAAALKKRDEMRQLQQSMILEEANDA